jgi:endo-1,4-beta-D-glucanase Y
MLAGAGQAERPGLRVGRARRGRGLSRLLILALALTLGALALFFVIGCGGGDDSSSSKSSKSVPDKRSDAVSKRFLDTYVDDDGRVQRADQGGDTVGEGQAYGMLIAVAIGDEQRFDKIWSWAKDNIQRPDGLLSFLWKDGKVADPEAASDADVDAARALLVASCRFKKPAYKQEALDLGKAILDNETASFQGSPVLVAGPWARKDPITVNPSYFSPATFAALGEATGDGRWGSLSASARSVTDILMPNEGSLPPDWASVQKGKPVPISAPGQTTGPGRFGFDAARTLVRMAEDPDPAGRRIAAKAWPAFDGKDPAQIPVEHDLNGQPAGGTQHPMALVAAAGAAYYGAAWVALGRIMLDSTALDCP